MADMWMELEIVTPDGVFYEGRVTMVEFNTTEGEVGIYPGHIPMAMIAAPGVMTITESEASKKAELKSGLIEIQKTKVTVLADKIKWI